MKKIISALILVMFMTGITYSQEVPGSNMET